MVVVISANISGGHVNPAVTFGLFVVPAFGLSGISIWSAFVFEIVATFGLVYKVYATAIDPKKGEIEIITPLAFGLIIGANILAAGPFTGATMNPTVVFGPTVVSFTWANHWIYWAGPLISGRLTGLMYEIFFISHTYEPSSGF